METRRAKTYVAAGSVGNPVILVLIRCGALLGPAAEVEVALAVEFVLAPAVMFTDGGWLLDANVFSS